MIATAPVRSGWVDFTIKDLAGTRRFTVDEYHKMIEVGILTADDRVELLDGYVVYKGEHLLAPDPNALFPAWRWLRRWTLGEYHRMVEVGILTTDDKVELLDGYVVLKMPQNRPHRSSLFRLVNRLPARLPAGWSFLSQCPVAVSGQEPEPDGAIVRGADSDYDDRDVTAADVAVLIEVADSSLGQDRGAKRRMYAIAGVPIYWVVNVTDRQIEVYSDIRPTTPVNYATRTDYLADQEVPLVLDGQQVGTIPATDLLS